MATIYIMKPLKPSITSMEFATYNEAISFMKKSEPLQPSKPYKRVVTGKDGKLVPVWFVTLGGSFRQPRRDFIKIDASKPVYIGIAA